MLMTFETIQLTLDHGVALVELNRPRKMNAIHRLMWDEIRMVFRQLSEMKEARVAVLCGAGPHFCAGIDVAMLTNASSLGESLGEETCAGRLREKLRLSVLELQDVVNTIERCTKPVLVALHGVCYGAAIDIATACDMRYASEDARISVKEIDLGLTADVGVLQRLPRVIGEGMARELAYTAREVSGREAKEIGLVNRCFATREELLEGVTQIARTMVEKSPLALRGCKEMFRYGRDHSVADALNYIATWNAAMLISDDWTEAMHAFQQKRQPKFRD
jgi:enoyl-CoA hydratase